MSEIVQRLCGKVNLYEADPTGAKRWVKHAMQVEEGVCVCSDPALWNAAVADMPPHYVGVYGDAEWPVHAWLTEYTPRPFTPSTYVTPPEELARIRAACEAFVPEPLVLTPQPLLPSAFARNRAKPKWLVHDPAPDITNRDTVEAPAFPTAVKGLVKLAEAGGWEVRVGYSRGQKRGQRTGSYRPIEVFGVWLGGGHPSGWRVSAMYERFADSKQEFTEFDDGTRTETVPAEGKGGSWSWRARIFSGLVRHEVKVTPLKEFLTVRGSVLPSWFETHAERVVQKEEAPDDAEE